MACGCRRLGAAFVCRRRGASFISMRGIQINKVYLISDKKTNQWSLIYYERDLHIIERVEVYIYIYIYTKIRTK